MKIVIEEAIEMIERQVKSYSTSTRISVPKKWANRKIKVILIKE
jgi:putative transposon-encoded protein